jgi:hypothetical protein
MFIVNIKNNKIEIVKILKLKSVNYRCFFYGNNPRKFRIIMIRK